MKRIFLMLLGLIVLSSGYGKRVSEQEAYKIASQFMDGKNIKTKPRLVKGEKDSPVFNNYYLYNFENNGGFVIVSGDDRTPSILGYADQGGIDLSNIPANFQWLLDYYDKELSSLASTEKAFPTGFNKVERINKYDIEPLIETQWGQGEPYNLNCPNVQGQRCVTGCVATAMAQVINYHRWPKEQTSGVDGYTTYSHNISMPDLPPMKLDWNNINDLAIARLMLYCGQSVQMDYDPFGSSAVAAFVSEALVNVFGFSKSAIHLKRNDYSDEDWDSLLFDQISDGLPVLYSGQSPTIGGHAFIVDGYEASRYHINWGWDGNCDGYFYLDSLDPFSDSGFTESQEMTINVIPPAGELSDDRPNAIIKYFICEERNIERVDVSSDFKTFSLKASIQNDVNNEISLELGFALYDDNGLVKILENTSHVFSINENYDFDAEIAITADIPQGDYRIISVSRTSDNKEWIANAGSTTTYVKVAVEEKSLHLQPYPLSEFDKNIIDYGTHTIDGITYFLQCEFGNGRAYPLKFEGEGQYKGDIYIPDYVIYQNMRFDIYYYIPYDNGIFDSNDEITSISTPIGLSITNCCNLRSITFRDGSASTGVINNCPLLEKVIFPKNCNYIAPINNCINLRSLSFNTNQRVTIGVCEDGSLWNHQTMPSLSDIYFNGAVPPSIPEWVSLPEPNESLIIHIPNGTFETYKYGGGDWCNWNLQEDLPELPISTKWDYCGEKISEYSGGIVFGCGSNNAETAMRIPSQYITAYKNCQITAIEFYTPGIAFNDDKCGNVEYVFLTTPGIDYIVKEPVVTVRGSWMRVELSTPYTITGDELFVGVGRPHALGAMWTNNEVVDDGFWARNMGPDDNRLLFAPSGVWLKHLGIEDWNHPLPIRAIIEGESLPTDIVIVSAEISSAPQQTMSPEDPSMLCSTPLSPKKEDEKYFISSFNIPNSGTDKTYSDDHKSQLKKVASEQDKMSIKIRNRCPYVVKNITLNWNIDGVAQQPINFQTGLPNNYEEEVIVDMPTDISGRYHSINVSVSAIDGKPDEVSENSEIEEIITSSPSKYFPRKFVLEEATGTWCGYCPLASATIEKTKELYPDNFIPIAIHDDDDMGLKNDSYDSFLQNRF